MSSSLSDSGLATAAEHLTAAKMFSLASCVMLFYDITITFSDEVEKIWKQRISGATMLWFLNRYISPLGYIIVIVSFHSSWPDSVCDRYVLYPEILKIFTAFVVGIIFILRLFSIYARSYPILYTFSVLLVGELSVKIWAFTDGTRLVLPPPLTGCILVGKSAAGKRFVYTWISELIFDTAVFIATLYRTLMLYKTSEGGSAQSLVRVILRDGIMYFAAIFASNLITTILFLTAPPDLKAVNASFSTLITSLMVSRLMLNLRREALRRSPVLEYRYSESEGLPSSEARFAVMSSMFTQTGSEDKVTFESSFIGNLGAPIAIWGDTDEEDSNIPSTKTDDVEMNEVGKGRRLEVEITEEVQILVDDRATTVIPPRRQQSRPRMPPVGSG